MKKIFVCIILMFLINALFAQKTKLMIQTGHQQEIYEIDLSPDETKLFTIDSDLKAILWDLKSGRQLRFFQNILCGSFQADNKSLLIKYKDGVFKTIDLSGNEIIRFPGDGTVGSGTHVNYTEGKIYPDLGVMLDGPRLVDIRKNTCINMFGKQSYCSDFAVLKNKIAVGEVGGMVSVYNASNGEKLKTIKLDNYGTNNTQFIHFSRDNNIFLARLGSIGTRTEIKIVDFESGNIVKEFTLNDHRVESVKLTPDGNSVIVLRDDKIYLLDIQSGKQIWEIDNSEKFTNATFLNNGSKILLTGKKKILSIFNSLTAKNLQNIKPSELSAAGKLSLSNNDQTLFSNKIPNWNFNNGSNEKYVLGDDTINNGYFTPDKKKKFDIITLQNGYNQVEEKDMTGHVPVFIYPIIEGWKEIYAFGISNDGKYIFYQSYRADIENTTNAKNLEIWEVSTHKKIAALNGRGHFFKNKNIFVLNERSEYGTVNFYELPSMKLLSSINDSLLKKAEFLKFSNNGKYLVMDEPENLYNLYILEPETKKSFTIDSYTDAYTKFVDFTPDDKFLVLGSAANTIAFINLETKQWDSSKTITLDIGGGSMNGGGVDWIVFSKNGKYMFVSCEDHTIKVWDMQNNNLLATLYSFPEKSDWAVLSPDGHFDGTKGAQENMYYVKGVNTIDLGDMYEKFYTPQLLKRLLNGEKINKEDIDIDDLHPKPRIKILYAEKTRNLEVGDDNPLYANTTGLAELNINATAQDDKVEEIRLFHNGKIVNLATRGLFVTDNDGSETKKYTINLLPGQNTFRAVALNGQRTESKADEIIVNYKNADNPSPINNKPININDKPIDLIDKKATLHLIVVGINQYQNKKMSLNYALADATSFKEELEKDVKSVIGNVKTYFVTDDAASKKGITEAFAAVQQNAKPQDVFIFYYAGHGVIGKDKEFYLVPTDVSNLADVQTELEQKGIPSKLLQQYAIDIQAQKQLFILDACQSAGAFETLISNDGNQQKSLAVVARSTGTHWMAASGAKQYANEFASLGHGVFTYILLQALKGEAANNKQVTVNGLKNFLQIQVPALMKKYNGVEQYPASYGFGNDFPVEVVK